MWQQWSTALLGLAVIVVPFLGLSGGAFTWTLTVLGVAIAALAVWGAVAYENRYETYYERMT